MNYCVVVSMKMVTNNFFIPGTHLSLLISKRGLICPLFDSVLILIGFDY